MNKKCVLLSLFVLILLSGCARKSQNLRAVDTTNLAQLENVQVSLTERSESSKALSRLRGKALKDAAMGVGAQGGLAWASEKMNAHLYNDRKYLETIYNFNAMMLEHGVLPPVLQEGDNSLNLADSNTIRVADKTYKILKQARFATTPPNWREYLWMTYNKPRLPDKTLLPRNNDEQRVWKRYLRKGWEKGIAQAYSIFQQNLARLKRDYRGMLLYSKLLEEKMISAPFVATTELGVTGDGGDMRINDQVLRIVELPQLQTNSRGWKAIVVKKHDE